MAGALLRVQLPDASPSANGGEQARIIVVSRANRDLDLWNDGNETKTFGHVVESVLKDLSAVRKDFFHLSSPIISLDLSTVRKAVTKQHEDRGFPVSRQGLRGWDFNDLAERGSEATMDTSPYGGGFRMRMACWSFLAKGLVGLYGLKLTPILHFVLEAFPNSQYGKAAGGKHPASDVRLPVM
jgi:hypothetical protein